MYNTLKYETTTFAGNIKNVADGTMELIPDNGAEEKTVNLYPDMRGQIFEGFGGAFTDSSGYIYSLMSEKDRKEMIHKYYSKEELNYTLGRVHIDSCDFSLGLYEAMSNEKDAEMKSFDISRTEKYILPLINDVKKLSGKDIEIMISPWSPPAFMKTNGERCHGGSLKDEYRKMWAEYICRYIKELKKAGCNIKRMSLQNEPKAVQTWDSCVYSAHQEKVFLRDFMYPALVENGFSDIEIFIWDHNKERVFERACEIIDETTDKMVAGIAFHWYSGDHFESLDLIKRKFPGKKLILSEACIEYSKYSADDYLANAQKYAHDIIGNFNNGMNAFYDWNILLDHTGGPNHVGNLCDAPFLYDTVNNKLTERNTLAYIRHFSHYINPGAINIANSKYTDKIDVTAFENPDKSIVAVILNRQNTEMTVKIRIKGKIAELVTDKESITTVVIK